MGSKIWAFIAFNFYSIFLISAFQENTAYLFDVSLIKEMRLSGLSVDPRQWGWGDHYMWRIISGITVTAVVGFLAGAISKTKGGITAAISNIPSVIVWALMIYLFGFSNVEVEGKTGFIVISVIAIPLTTYIAHLSGNFGEEIQRDEFCDDTVLGVKGYHWIWAVFPIYWYSLGIVFVVSKFIAFQLATWGDMSIFVSVMSLIALIPIIAWIYPLILVHRVLSAQLLSTQKAFVRGLANFGILILGMGIASLLQVGSYWLLAKISS